MKPAEFNTPAGLISVRLVTVTPAQAVEWLATQKRNRKLRTRHLGLIKRDMTRGDFAFTAAGISFDTEGNLLDGQHRLTGIAESGVSVPLFIFEGFPSATQDSMDLGAGRTAAEQMSMDGIANANITVAYLNAIARGFLSYETKLSLPQVRECLIALPRLAWAVSQNTSKLEIRNAIYLGVIALALHLPKSKQAAAVGYFHDSFTRAIGIHSEEHPAWRLRQFAFAHPGFGGPVARKAAAYTADCIEAAVTGKPMTTDKPTGTGRDWLRAQLPEQYRRLREITGFQS